MIDIPVTEFDVRRFFRHVTVEDECWTWNGARHQQGYGLMKIRGKLVRANRLSYRIYHGYWPVWDTCHTCDNPPCVLINHLYDGTRSQNMIDKYDRILKRERR